ncbi:MAG: hypothetical protein D6797_07725 [Bdellovibrio sp.]|nr:MAG: hypothetical protein D6797_07725 [Bdellovibrio sp.]
MRKIIICLGLFFCSPAWALWEVDCLGGDCLTYGWQIKNPQTGQNSKVYCINQDCETYGWYEASKLTSGTRSECIGSGCFVDGWHIFETASGRLLQTVTCNKGPSLQGDCLIWGWKLTGFGFAPVQITCTENDCRGKGWTYNDPRKGRQTVVCKPGGCFIEGWIQY